MPVRDIDAPTAPAASAALGVKAPDADLAGRPDFNPGLVAFYSRLTRTLEDRAGEVGGCGPGALARRLRDSRLESGDPDAASAQALHAVARSFQRMRLLPAGRGAGQGAAAADFARRVADAVNRPSAQVLELLRLFSCGDDALPLPAVCGAVPACACCRLTRDCEFFNKPRKPAQAARPAVARLLDAGDDAALSDAELLALVVFGDKATGTEPLVASLLARYGRLTELFRAGPAELLALRDMRRAQAARLAAAARLFSRLLREVRDERLRITSARDFYDRYAPELRGHGAGAAVLVMLDSHNTVLRDKWFLPDSPAGLRLTMAEVLRPAVQAAAARVALVRCSVAGGAEPSLEESNFTRSLRSACDLLGLTLVDHVLVAGEGYYSFAESGRLER